MKKEITVSVSIRSSLNFKLFFYQSIDKKTFKLFSLLEYIRKTLKDLTLVCYIEEKIVLLR